jgi:S-adenosylmethionine-diacylgycerolhomoserine-N-methlytransferase
MSAQSHSVLMDQVYRQQRHFYDLTRKYYLFGRDRLIARLDLKPGARAIEIGCGTARNLIAIARRYPKARLYGLDASSEMLKTASEKITKAGLYGKIPLVVAYAENLSPALFGEAETFDAAIFSYSLSMIPDWRAAIVAAAASLNADGRIHIVDFGDLEGLPRPFRRLLRAWLALFHVTPRAELLAVLEKLAAEDTNVNLQLLPGRYAFVLSGSGPALAKLAR